jgi:hypothetical protein
MPFLLIFSLRSRIGLHDRLPDETLYIDNRLVKAVQGVYVPCLGLEEGPLCVQYLEIAQLPLPKRLSGGLKYSLGSWQNFISQGSSFCIGC